MTKKLKCKIILYILITIMKQFRCGVPHHSLEHYLEKLIKQGIVVGIVDQLETPEEAKKHKRIIKRDVTRIVTPGTLFEDRFLNPKKNNYLMSITRGDGHGDMIAITYTDISTGELYTTIINGNSLLSELSRIQPSEILVSDSLYNDCKFKDIWKSYHTTLHQLIDNKEAESLLLNLYQIESIKELGDLTQMEIMSTSVILKYLIETQMTNKIHINKPQQYNKSTQMIIDGDTQRALELINTNSGDKKKSLLSIIDKTVTASGARLLRSYLTTPLLDLNLINNRLNTIQFLIENPNQYILDIRNYLKHSFDIERSLQRLYLRNGSPRDLLSIAITIQQSLNLFTLLNKSKEIIKTIPLLNDIVCKLTSEQHIKILKELEESIVNDPPAILSDGGFLKNGYNVNLDNLRKMNTNSQELIEQLQMKYRNITNISTLKIKKSDKIGYYIEVLSQHTSKINNNKTFLLFESKQTSSKYKTEELTKLEAKLNSAVFESIQLEQQIFEELRQLVTKNGKYISDTAHSLACLDVFTSLALLSKDNKYVKPIVNNTTNFNIKGGRHPTVEHVLQEISDSHFTRNDCDLSIKKLCILTGPNMGGKSTYLRMNAIIGIMAQMGSYVPCEFAEIGIIDAIYSRLGSSDDLTKDRSTFMVEMLETSKIVNRATNKSFVILDEVGKATATFDGLSIAWATIEHLYNFNKCRTLFATHYHELSKLQSTYSGIDCRSMAIKHIVHIFYYFFYLFIFFFIERSNYIFVQSD